MSRFVIRVLPAGIKFDLKAPNGQTIATSELYSAPAACMRGINSVRKNAPKAVLEDQTLPLWKPQPHPKFELYQDRAGQYRFRLKATNGKIIATSEGYATKAACENGMESVRKNAPDAETEEE